MMQSTDSEESFQQPRNNRIMNFVRQITVEPTMFLYMMAFMVTSVVEQSFFVYKACTVNHGYNSTICDNINKKQYKEYHEIVQVTVAEFHQWSDIGGHVVPIILAFFMGSWSDRRGRKLPLLFGLCGKFYYSAMVVVNALIVTWPVEYVLYTATIPSALTGADVAIFAAAFSYISDVSTRENRTMRVTILDVVYLSTMPTGVALGSYLFSSVTNRSYAIMFTINASLMFCSILYTVLRLEWRTNEQQRPWKESNNMITDFFDRKHVVHSIKTLLKPRPKQRRVFLCLFIVIMALYTFQRDENPMAYLYLTAMFEWTTEQFSSYKTFKSAFQVVAMLVGIPIMSKLFNWPDTVIIMVGAIAHAVARVVYALAPEAWWFYIGGALSALGPVVGPALRAMVSKIVPITERGTVFSLLSVADNAIPLVSGTLYAQVYNHTLKTHPNAIFYLTMATQLAVFLLISCVHFFSQPGSLHHDDTETEVLNDPETNETPDSLTNIKYIPNVIQTNEQYVKIIPKKETLLVDNEYYL